MAQDLIPSRQLFTPESAKDVRPNCRSDLPHHVGCRSCYLAPTVFRHHRILHLWLSGITASVLSIACNPQQINNADGHQFFNILRLRFDPQHKHSSNKQSPMLQVVDLGSVCTTEALRLPFSPYDTAAQGVLQAVNMAV